MLGQLIEVDDDWTSVIDDLDHFGLSDNVCPLVPLSQLHRNESKFQSQAQVSMSDMNNEEYKGLP